VAKRLARHPSGIRQRSCPATSGPPATYAALSKTEIAEQSDLLNANLPARGQERSHRTQLASVSELAVALFGISNLTATAGRRQGCGKRKQDRKNPHDRHGSVSPFIGRNGGHERRLLVGGSERVDGSMQSGPPSYFDEFTCRPKG
jgi:hypothetical protein